jgi:hypothetical protein
MPIGRPSIKILAMKNITPQMHSPADFQRIRDHQANGMGGLPLVGDPDMVARDISRLAEPSRQTGQRSSHARDAAEAATRSRSLGEGLYTNVRS